MYRTVEIKIGASIIPPGGMAVAIWRDPEDTEIRYKWKPIKRLKPEPGEGPHFLQVSSISLEASIDEDGIEWCGLHYRFAHDPHCTAPIVDAFRFEDVFADIREAQDECRRRNYGIKPKIEFQMLRTRTGEEPDGTVAVGRGVAGRPPDKTEVPSAKFDVLDRVIFKEPTSDRRPYIVTAVQRHGGEGRDQFTYDLRLENSAGSDPGREDDYKEHPEEAIQRAPDNYEEPKPKFKAGDLVGLVGSSGEYLIEEVIYPTNDGIIRYRIPECENLIREEGIEKIYHDNPDQDGQEVARFRVGDLLILKGWPDGPILHIDRVCKPDNKYDYFRYHAEGEPEDASYSEHVVEIAPDGNRTTKFKIGDLVHHKPGEDVEPSPVIYKVMARFRDVPPGGSAEEVCYQLRTEDGAEAKIWGRNLVAHQERVES